MKQFSISKLDPWADHLKKGIKTDQFLQSLRLSIPGMSLDVDTSDVSLAGDTQHQSCVLVDLDMIYTYMLYPLVKVYIANWKDPPFFMGKLTENFDWAMFNG